MVAFIGETVSIGMVAGWVFLGFCLVSFQIGWIWFKCNQVFNGFKVGLDIVMSVLIIF